MIHFVLANIEDNGLIEKNIDPIKVKCAIVSLLKEIENSAGSANWLFFNTPYLKIIKELRQGKLNVVKVDNLLFDLRLDSTIKDFYLKESNREQIDSEQMNKSSLAYAPSSGDYNPEKNSLSSQQEHEEIRYAPELPNQEISYAPSDFKWSSSKTVWICSSFQSKYISDRRKVSLKEITSEECESNAWLGSSVFWSSTPTGINVIIKPLFINKLDS